MGLPTHDGDDYVVIDWYQVEMGRIGPTDKANSGIPQFLAKKSEFT